MLLFLEHGDELGSIAGSDDAALAQFHIDHNIPNDVLIKRPSQNDDVDWVEGEGERMPVRTWFIH